jgi:hypothetical protein
MNTKQNVAPETVSSTDWLEGVSREMAILAAGFCTGLSETDRFAFDEHDRKILKTAGTALLALTTKPPNAKLTDTGGEPSPLGPEGCCFPGKCCMPGPHYESECHTAEMLMALESQEASAPNAAGKPPLEL